MIAAFQRRPLIVTLAVLAAALAAIIAIEMGLGAGLRPGSAPTPSKRAVAADAKLLPPVVAVAPEQAYPEVTSRPLFLPTRRPAPEAVAAVKSTYVPGQFVLQGVTVAGDTRIAMLREKSTGRIHRVERGREVNGIKVVEVQPETVTLGQDGDTEVLSLSVQRPATAPTAAAAVQSGPFAAATAPTAAPVAPAGVQAVAAPGQAAVPQTPTGSAMTRQPPGMFPLPSTALTPPPSPANPPQASARDTAAPLSPEELLARRRSRRNQPNQ